MEFVFVLPRADLFRDCYPQGLVPFGPQFPLEAFEALVERRGYFVERDHAEHDPSLKQVIPYSIVTRDGEVLLLERTAGGGEKRLFHKLSIGVGGHINPEDALEGIQRKHNPIASGTRRELEEELDITGSWSVHPVGILNDDSNAVGAVHVGLVQIVRLRGSATIREQSVLQGRFVAAAELVQLLREGANYETWSARLVEFLEREGSELLREPNAQPA